MFNRDIGIVRQISRVSQIIMWFVIIAADEVTNLEQTNENFWVATVRKT